MTHFGWFLIFVSFACPSTGSLIREPRDRVYFDYLLLSQFWPSTSCLYFENEHKECLVPQGVTGWTIHGLWPSIRGTEKPDYCNKSMPFDFNQIEKLSPRLATNWPYYCKEGPKTSLWEHEWTKHGTCAFSVDILQGELRYFNQTLNLHDKLNTSKILASNNIVPSETKQYEPMDIFNAVKKGYGKIPDITCFYDQKTRTHHLEQVWLCYDKQLQHIDCPEVAYSRRLSSTLHFEGENSETNSYFEGCPKHGTVYYKPIPSTGSLF